MLFLRVSSISLTKNLEGDFLHLALGVRVCGGGGRRRSCGVVRESMSICRYFLGYLTFVTQDLGYSDQYVYETDHLYKRNANS